MKPQIERMPLDERDASPHLRSMSNDGSDRKPPAESREAKLAKALRANLRRRKAAAAAPPAPKPHESSTD